jgi:hypothetical protein
MALSTNRSRRRSCTRSVLIWRLMHGNARRARFLCVKLPECMALHTIQYVVEVRALFRGSSTVRTCNDCLYRRRDCLGNGYCNWAPRDDHRLSLSFTEWRVSCADPREIIYHLVLTSRNTSSADILTSNQDSSHNLIKNALLPKILTEYNDILSCSRRRSVRRISTTMTYTIWTRKA